jgi:hypothetical protein
MSKKRQTGLDNVAMFAFGRAILLVSVWVGHMVGDAELDKEGMKLLIFASPVCLYSNDLAIELSFYKSLEFLEILKHFRLEF